MMMLRLYFYKYDKDFVETDEMNPLMVVANYKSLSSKYLVNKTELDDEALGYQSSAFLFYIISENYEKIHFI